MHARHCVAICLTVHVNTVVQTDCEDCTAGRYANETAATGCKLCPDGYFTDSARRSACTQCAPGFVSTAIRTSCKACPPGTYQASGSVCLPCAAGTVSEGGVTSCRQCSAGFSADVHECVACPPGTYSLQGGACIPCPKCVGPRCASTAAGTCEDGQANLNGYYWVVPLPGQSALSADVTSGPIVYRCVSATACGGTTACACFAVPHDGSLTRSNSRPFPGFNATTLLPVCSTGYSGLLCNLCAPGYTKQLDATCSECTRSLWVSILVIVVVVLVCLAILWVLVRFREVLPTGTFKVLMAFAQILATGEALFATQWPAPYSTFVRSFRVRGHALPALARAVLTGWAWRVS